MVQAPYSRLGEELESHGIYRAEVINDYRNNRTFCTAIVQTV